MKVYNSEPLGYSPNAILKWEAIGWSYIEGSWHEIDHAAIFEDVDILIVRLDRIINANILNKFPNLKKLITATTGHDHIDLAALKERNIELVSLRGHDIFLKTIPSTAEHTWALMMALIRNIPAANEHVKNGGWNRDFFRGIQLKDKTIGIVGYGRTGQKVAQYARAFNMEVRYYDPCISINKEEKIETLEELLQISDILTLHVHLSDKTEKLINAENLKHLKPGAFIINTSRGKIWDEIEVVDLLRRDLVKGLATDVLSTELSGVLTNPLWLAQNEGMNVIITPHIGGATWDAMWACEEYILRLFENES